MSIKRNRVLPFLAIVANWMIIAACIGISLASGSLLLTALAIVIIGARQHALFIMVHEATHMHISQNKRVNDWTSDLFCAFPLLFDTGVYRKNHLTHHRHMNTDKDPDWTRKQSQLGWTFPVKALNLAMFIPAYVFVLGPIEVFPIFWGFSGFGDKNRWKNEAPFLLFKVAYFAIAGFLLYKFDILKEAAIFWLAPMMFVLPFVARVRNLSEHFAVTYEDENNSTREVAAGWLEGFLFTPHNVNLHLTHHRYPHIPFYRLQEAHRELCRIGEYDNAQMNGSFFLPYKNSVLSDVLNGPRRKKQNEKAA